MTGARMNSKHMPNTLTNTLESIGGVPEPPAANKSSKTGFLCFGPSFALAELCAFMRHGTLRVHVNFVEKSVFRGEGGRETHETRSRSSTIHQPTLQADWRGL